MVRVYQVFGERVYLFVLVGEVCLGYSRARYRRPSPGFDPAHPQFSIGIAWIGGTVESAYTVYNVPPPPVCLFVYLCHRHMCCLFCLLVSPSGLVLLIDGQWTSAKSDCAHSIRRALAED